ncbi:MAG: hypothetical protein ACI33P_09850, partial [Lysinibacillus sp.]
MKKYIQNERGYALLIAIGTILIFTVLGLSLITLTSNGIVKNTHREDTIIAQDLSDKGIAFAVNDIQRTLEQAIKTTPMGKTAFENLLVSTLNKTALKCPAAGQPIPDHIGFHIPAENDNITKVCIEAVKMITNASGVAEEKDRYKRLVTFRSYGIVKRKEHISKTDVMIGTDAIPDQLKYTISTNDEGNLYLHGGVEIQGDVKTDGHLIISEKAHWLRGDTAVWEDSVATRIIPAVKSITPKVIMRESGKNIYIMKNPRDINYNSHIAGGNYLENNMRYTKYLPTNTATTGALQDQLFLTNNVSLVTRNLPGDSVEITEKITPLYTNKRYKTNYPTGLTVTDGNQDISKFKRDDVVFVHGEKRECRIWIIICLAYHPPTLDKADFTINGRSGTSRRTIRLSGTYYINGDFSVENTQLQSDAMLYVNGNVNIKESTLNGINPDSTIFIFATGDISISNISVDQSTPSIIKGFFYSKQNMIMYGVGSNINLYGGISAKRTILTAVRGDSNNYTYESQARQRETQIVNGVATPKRSSRLKIVYDEN